VQQPAPHAHAHAHVHTHTHTHARTHTQTRTHLAQQAAGGVDRPPRHVLLLLVAHARLGAQQDALQVQQVSCGCPGSKAGRGMKGVRHS